MTPPDDRMTGHPPSFFCNFFGQDEDDPLDKESSVRYSWEKGTPTGESPLFPKHSFAPAHALVIMVMRPERFTFPRTRADAPLDP
jgi:hypothetical protein